MLQLVMNTVSTSSAETLASRPSLTPPPTVAEPVREVFHDVEVLDEYRWLEGSAAPEANGAAGELDGRVSAWTDAQNAYTRGILDELPGREALEKRLRELMEVDQVGDLVARRNRYFYWQREGGQSQWTVWMREGLKGEPRLLLDLNRVDPDGLTALAWLTPNHDGTLAAFGLFRAGDENSTLYVLDVDSGDWLAEEIRGKVEGVTWLPDSTGFVYHCLEDFSNPYSRQLKFHRLGTHPRQDRLLFEQAKEGPLATTWGPFGLLSRDARWLLFGYWTSTDSHDLWVVDFDRWLRTGEFVRTPILVGERAVGLGPIVGDRLFLRTTYGATNGRVFSIDLTRPEREAWREIIPEREDAVLENLSAARGQLVASYLKNASSHVERFGYDGRLLGVVDLPGIGSAQMTTREDHTETFLTFHSFNRPPTIYRVDLASGERRVWAEPKVPVDPASIEVRQVWYPGRDGTPISMFLVHRKDLRPNGKVPTLLSGYGGFRVSLTPSFRSTLIPWLEAGGLYAVANLRGGGEYGESWHRAGMMANKQTVFDDFLAAAEWLIDEGYTSPAHLAIRGGSNGGLLTGAALVQRPDLFAAVVSSVPLLDMLRYQHFLMARYWVPEYGSSEKAEDFAFLRRYSPYHNVRRGVHYPAVLLTAGENDARVHPLHARKMAARLQAATASDPAEDPVLLWVDRSAGHGRGKPLQQQIETIADELIFVLWQLGVEAD